MSDHAEKGHPIGGYIAVIIIAALFGYLFKMFNSSDLAGFISGGLFLVWGVVALAIFSRGDDTSAAHH
jgi:predicted membrane channel-forming protein YqfA (hemolysin III family)